MKNDKNIYVSLEALAAELYLPQKYLRGLAKQGDIPALNVNRRLRFNVDDVRIALAKMAAAKGGKHE